MWENVVSSIVTHLGHSLFLQECYQSGTSKEEWNHKRAFSDHHSSALGHYSSHRSSGASFYTQRR